MERVEREFVTELVSSYAHVRIDEVTLSERATRSMRAPWHRAAVFAPT